MEYEIPSVIKDNSEVLSPKTGRLKPMITKMKNSGRAGLRAGKTRHSVQDILI